MSIRFAKYGSSALGGGVSLADLITESKETSYLWAHAEDSGCESCYVEVAKWDDKHKAWFKYAFLKTLDVLRGLELELECSEDASDEEVAVLIAKKINDVSWEEGRASIVGAMANHPDTEDAKTSKVGA